MRTPNFKLLSCSQNSALELVNCSINSLSQLPGFLPSATKYSEVGATAGVTQREIVKELPMYGEREGEYRPVEAPSKLMGPENAKRAV